MTLAIARSNPSLSYRSGGGAAAGSAQSGATAKRRDEGPLVVSPGAPSTISTTAGRPGWRNLKNLICLLTYLLRTDWGEARTMSAAESARAATVADPSEGLVKKSWGSLKIGRSVSGTGPTHVGQPTRSRSTRNLSRRLR